ncbi:MAG: hypothetical protein ABIN89_09965 [Chitinophagaceae bacterium]
MTKTIKTYLITIVVVFAGITPVILAFMPNQRHNEVSPMVKSKKFKFSINSWDEGYVIEIDSIEYVVVKARDGVAIIRHRDLHVLQK